MGLKLIAGSGDELTLDENVFAIIQPALLVLEQKTGVRIDQYTDLKLYPDHSKILLDDLVLRGNVELEGIKQLVSVLQSAIQSDKIIELIGD